MKNWWRLLNYFTKHSHDSDPKRNWPHNRQKSHTNLRPFRGIFVGQFDRHRSIVTMICRDICISCVGVSPPNRLQAELAYTHSKISSIITSGNSTRCAINFARPTPSRNASMNSARIARYSSTCAPRNFAGDQVPSPYN